MFTRIRFSGELLNIVRKPLPDVILNLEISHLRDGWVTLSEAQTRETGAFKGSLAVDDFAELRVTPQFRLVDPERQTTFDVVPNSRLSGQSLVLDFGTITRLQESTNVDPNEIDPTTARELTRIKLELFGKDIELTEARTRLESANTSLTATSAEKDELQLQLDQIRTAEESSPRVAELAERVASSLFNAGDAGATSGFRLDSATVKLRGYLVGGGDRFKPLDAAELASANSGAASEISFDLRPPASGPASGSTMPDVIGLTASTARQALRALGVDVNVVEKPGRPVGAIVAQTPVAGAALDPGSIVHLEVAVGP